ncbi:hypothetical protein [Pseudomonas syringae]|uniref:hypothetical protein n=1 Tax=Pseudomonas syringae TaxID=317 RepID=UPI0034D45F55
MKVYNLFSIKMGDVDILKAFKNLYFGSIIDQNGGYWQEIRRQKPGKEGMKEPNKITSHCKPGLEHLN